MSEQFKRRVGKAEKANNNMNEALRPVLQELCDESKALADKLDAYKDGLPGAVLSHEAGRAASVLRNTVCSRAEEALKAMEGDTEDAPPETGEVAPEADA